MGPLADPFCFPKTKPFRYPSGGGDLWARFFYPMLVHFEARQQLDGSSEESAVKMKAALQPNKFHQT